MANKMTKKEKFNMVLELVKGNEMLEEFIAHELELLEKKSANKKATKTQVENEKLKETVLDVLGASENALTVTELLKAHADFAELSNQKMSALVSALCNDKVVYRFVEKKKAYFRLATENDYAEIVTE